MGSGDDRGPAPLTLDCNRAVLAAGEGACTGFLLGGPPPTAVLLNAQVPGGAQPLRIPAAKEREGCVGEQT